MMCKSFIYKWRPKLILVGALFMFLLVGKAYSQNEWALNDYPAKIVNLLAETYDGGIICQVLPFSQNNPAFNQPVYLVKYSMEGKKLWEKKLNNIFYIQGVSSTQDSGFIIAVTVYTSHVDSLSQDTSGYIALLKFDKCAHLQWARYVKTVHQGEEPTNVIENNKDFYLCTLGINGYSDYYNKPVTILKFSHTGVLLGYKSFIGHNAMLYQNQNADTVYFSQDIDAPVGNDTTVVYLFSGIQSIDTTLKTNDSVVVGYYNRIYNETGPLIIKSNTVEATTDVHLSNGNQDPMFSVWNKSLSQIGSFMYDSIKKFSNLFPLFSNFRNDSLVVCNQVSNSLNDSFFTSMRLYDKNYHVLKESIINKNWFQNNYSFLALKNGDFIVSEVISNPYTVAIEYTSFFRLSSALNPIPWPTIPPSKGYDWACNTTIPDSETINVDSVVTPVYVAVDTTKPNWHNLGINMPQNAIQGRSENGWLAWPEPVSMGSPLYFKSLSNSSIQNFQVFDVLFNDVQGRQVYKTNAIYLSNNQWVIPSISLPNPGMYMVELRNQRTRSSLGKIKVVVE